MNLAVVLLLSFIGVALFNIITLWYVTHFLSIILENYYRVHRKYFTGLQYYLLLHHNATSIL